MRELTVHPGRVQVASALAEDARRARERVALGRTHVTWGELELEVFDALGLARPATAVEVRVAVFAAARAVGERIPAFARVASRSGFARSLGADLEALDALGLDSDALAAASTPALVEGRSAVAVAVQRALGEKLAVVNAARVATLRARARSHLARGARLDLPYARVVVRGAQGLDGTMLGWLEAVARATAPRTEFVLELAHGAGPLFAFGTRVLSALERQGERAALTVTPVDPSDGEGAGPALLRRLEGRGDPAADGAVSCFEAPTPTAEREAVARLVRAALEAGTRESQIVVAPRSAREVPALVRALERAGVRAFGRASSPLAHAPPVRFLLDALQVGAHGYPPRAVARLLGSRLSARLVPGRAPAARDVYAAFGRIGRRATPGEPASTLAALVRPIAPVGERLAARLEALAALVEPVLEAGTLGAACERLAAAFMALDLAPLAAGQGALARATLRGAGIARGYVELDRATELTGAEEREPMAAHESAPALGAAAASSHGAARRGGAAPNDVAFAMTADETRALQRDAAAVLGFEDALLALATASRRLAAEVTLTRDDVPAALTALLSGEIVETRAVRGGVEVTALSSVVGRRFELVFVPVAIDGVLPAPPPASGILSLGDRLALATLASPPAGGLAVDLDAAGTVYDVGEREREPYLFALALASVGQRIVFSRALADERGRPTRASRWVDELLAAASRPAAPLRPDRAPRDACVSATSPLAAPAGPLEVRRALAAEIGRVHPGTPLAALTRRRLRDAPALDRLRSRGSVPRRDADDDFGLRDVLARADVERARLHALFAPSTFAGDVELASHVGRVGGAGGRAAAEFASRERPASPSALETLAACPFRFFASYVLRVGSPPDVLDEPDPRDGGTVAHACFEAAIQALLDHGLHRFVRADAPRARGVAREAAARVVDEHLAPLAIDPALRAHHARTLVRRIERLVEALFESDDGFSIVAVELAFGEGERWPSLVLSSESGDEELVIHGRADLVSRRGEVVRVDDLKTRSMASLRNMLSAKALGATSLQLPIYAAAARAAEGHAHLPLFRGVPEGVETDARYLSLPSGEASKSLRTRGARGEALAAEELVALERDGVPTALASRLVELVRLARRGDFRVMPTADACDHCEAASLCRIVPTLAEEGDA